jgi:anti-sigma B factor antagonist
MEGDPTMSMKANILRDANGNIIVHMQGDLNYDVCSPLRTELQTIARENPNAKISIDLGAIDFVGSSGICHFVETVKYLKEGRKSNVNLTNVKPEFLKIFKLLSLNETEYVAELMNFDEDDTENLSQRFGNRTVTFEN